MLKLIAYSVVVAGYIVGGCADLKSGDAKSFVLALIFAAANAVIFFWR